MLVFTKIGKTTLKPMSQILALLKLVAFSYCLQRMQVMYSVCSSTEAIKAQAIKK